MLGHPSLFFLFPIEKLVLEHVKQESITSHVEGMMVKREKMEYQFQDKYFLEQSRELTTISVMTKLD